MTSAVFPISNSKIHKQEYKNTHSLNTFVITIELHSVMDNSILDPLVCIEKLFIAGLSSTDDNYVENFVRNGFGEKEHFDQELLSHFISDQISVFGTEPLGQIKPNCLVRYQGLIQDIFDPEYYCGGIKSWCSTTGEKKIDLIKYRDSVVSAVADDSWICEDVVCERYQFSSMCAQKNTYQIVYLRTAMLCIPIPGETKWAVPPHISSVSVTTQGRHKRRVDDDNCMMVVDSELI